MKDIHPQIVFSQNRTCQGGKNDFFYFKTLFSITTEMGRYDTSDSSSELGRFKIYMVFSNSKQTFKKSTSAINGLPVTFLRVYSCCRSIFNKR